MYIPTPEEEYENKQWQLSYIHFAMRLKQRYDMQISFEEYQLLCREPVVKHIDRKTNNRSIAVVKFRNAYIVCGVKKNSYLGSAAKLRTALPLNKKYRTIIKNL